MGDALVEPRHAASLIAIQREGKTRVLMARRRAHLRFMPHHLVFPGGAVDPADFATPIASALRPEVAARLARSYDEARTPGLAQALAVAAARECEEEVGLSLGTPPALGGMDYLCRAITPPDRPIRFDARFLIVDAAALRGEPADSEELEAPGWFTIDQALAEDIALPTQGVLMQLRAWLAAPGGDTVPVRREGGWSEE